MKKKGGNTRTARSTRKQNAPFGAYSAPCRRNMRRNPAQTTAASTIKANDAISQQTQNPRNGHRSQCAKASRNTSTRRAHAICHRRNLLVAGSAATHVADFSCACTAIDDYQIVNARSAARKTGDAYVKEGLDGLPLQKRCVLAVYGIEWPGLRHAWPCNCCCSYLQIIDGHTAIFIGECREGS